MVDSIRMNNLETDNLMQFVEVDPVHEDVLRKKEEQDIEKSQRHLFRFPHMGMWTKLRPGIWNFLEKVNSLSSCF